MSGKAVSDPCSAHPPGLVSRNAFPSWKLSHHSRGGCRQRWEDAWLEKHVNEPRLFPPALTWLHEDLVTCLGVIPPAFSMLRQNSLSLPCHGSCVCWHLFSDLLEPAQVSRGSVGTCSLSIIGQAIIGMHFHVCASPDTP